MRQNYTVSPKGLIKSHTCLMSTAASLLYSPCGWWLGGEANGPSALFLSQVSVFETEPRHPKTEFIIRKGWVTHPSEYCSLLVSCHLQAACRRKSAFAGQVGCLHTTTLLADQKKKVCTRNMSDTATPRSLPLLESSLDR